MKQTKHTPGPWSWSAINGDNFVMAKIGKSRVVVAEAISDPANGPGISLEELDANKILIATAPELLAALNNLFKHCVMVRKLWGENANQSEADAAIAAARAAIAKAEGKQ